MAEPTKEQSIKDMRAARRMSRRRALVELAGLGVIALLISLGIAAVVGGATLFFAGLLFGSAAPALSPFWWTGFIHSVAMGALLLIVKLTR